MGSCRCHYALLNNAWLRTRRKQICLAFLILWFSIFLMAKIPSEIQTGLFTQIGNLWSSVVPDWSLSENRLVKCLQSLKWTLGASLVNSFPSCFSIQ